MSVTRPTSTGSKNVFSWTNSASGLASGYSCLTQNKIVKMRREIRCKTTLWWIGRRSGENGLSRLNTMMSKSTQPCLIITRERMSRFNHPWGLVSWAEESCKRISLPRQTFKSNKVKWGPPQLVDSKGEYLLISKLGYSKTKLSLSLSRQSDQSFRKSRRPLQTQIIRT